MPSITATRSTTRAFIAAALALCPPGTASADAGINRLLAEVSGLRLEAPLPAREALLDRCGTDLHCAAAALAEALGPQARLEQTTTPDTDTIRWARTASTVAAATEPSDSRLVVSLTGFGRKTVAQLRAVLAKTDGQLGTLILDLRNNRGGDFGRMLEVAALFAEPVPRAVALHAPDGGTRWLAIPERRPLLPGHGLWVWIGPATASSAEILAALLRQHAVARILGQHSFGKDYLLRVVPVNQDWRLLVPAERVEVPGESLSGGLVPDLVCEPEACLSDVASDARQ